MCMELRISVMIGVHKHQGLFDRTTFACPSFDKVFSLGRGEELPAFAKLFEEKCMEINFSKAFSRNSYVQTYALPSKPSLLGM